MLTSSFFRNVQRNNIYRVPVRHTGFVRDVYKSLNYKAPVTGQENEMIVKRLNTYNEDELKSFVLKKHIKSIVEYREKTEGFQVVEQLLDINKFEISQLEKLCKSFQKQTTNTSWSQKSRQNVESYENKGIFPRVDLDLVKDDSTILGLSVTFSSVAYALIQSDELISWSNIPIEGKFTVSHFYHHRLFPILQDVVEKLPEADFCIQEEMQGLFKADPYVRDKVNTVKTRCYLDCIHTNSNKISSSRHLMKHNYIDKLFKLNIGGERISMKDRLGAITSETDGNNVHRLQISEEDMLYFKLERTRAESLAGACLAALAFRYHLNQARENHQSGA